MSKSPAKAIGDAAESQDDYDEEQGKSGGSIALADDEEMGEDDQVREGNGLPSGSNTSLTPPPTSPAARVDVDVPPSTETASLLHQGLEAEKVQDDTGQLKFINGGDNGGGDNDHPREEQEMDEDDVWETYRRHRAVKGFVRKDDGVKSESGEIERDGGDHQLGNAVDVNGDQSQDQHQQQHIDVLPDADEPEDSNHPPRTRSKPIPRDMSAISASDGNTPASASGSDANLGRAGSRQGRRRRGEEQLLLDDHLLPAEIRRTALAERAKKEEEEEVEVEEGEEEGEEDMEEGDGPGEQEEDEEGKDITRCVCKREG